MLVSGSLVILSRSRKFDLIVLTFNRVKASSQSHPPSLQAFCNLDLVHLDHSFHHFIDRALKHLSTAGTMGVSDEQLSRQNVPLSFHAAA
jgi:hypothetical protein